MGLRSVQQTGRPVRHDRGVAAARRRHVPVLLVRQRMVVLAELGLVRTVPVRRRRADDGRYDTAVPVMQPVGHAADHRARHGQRLPHEMRAAAAGQLAGRRTETDPFARVPFAGQPQQLALYARRAGGGGGGGGGRVVGCHSWGGKDTGLGL